MPFYWGYIGPQLVLGCSCIIASFIHTPKEFSQPQPHHHSPKPTTPISSTCNPPEHGLQIECILGITHNNFIDNYGATHHKKNYYKIQWQGYL